MFNKTSQTVLLLLILSISSFAIYSYHYPDVDTFKHSGLYIFMFILTAISTIVIAFSLYFDAKTREDDEQVLIDQSTSKINHDVWIEPINYIAEHYSNLGDIPKQLFPDLKIRNETDMYQIAIANRLFQSCEDYLTLHNLDNTTLSNWLGSFLEWSQSVRLAEIWKDLKINFDPRTIDFIDFLFLHGQRLSEIRNKSSNGKLSYKQKLNFINNISPTAFKLFRLKTQK